jgi:hypothetical protein
MNLSPVMLPFGRIGPECLGVREVHEKDLEPPIFRGFRKVIVITNAQKLQRAAANRGRMRSAIGDPARNS